MRCAIESPQIYNLGSETPVRLDEAPSKRNKSFDHCSVQGRLGNSLKTTAMEAFDRIAMRRQLIEATFRRRDEAERYRIEAEAVGNRKDARSWASRIRKLDKEIAKYGLKRPGNL